MENLASALEVSLVELMQAKRNENEQISTKDAEKLLVDTIQLSKSSNKLAKGMGMIILSGFVLVSIFLLVLLIFDGKMVLYSVGSIFTGLIAWGLPIWQITIVKAKNTVIPSILSLGFALTSLAIQFMDIANEVNTGDLAAIEDTINALVMVVVLFSAITFVLNIIMVVVGKYKK